MKLWATHADLPDVIPLGELWLDESLTPEEREAIIAEHLPPGELVREPTRYAYREPVRDDLQRFQALGQLLRDALAPQTPEHHITVEAPKPIPVDTGPIGAALEDQNKALLALVREMRDAMTANTVALAKLVGHMSRPKTVERDDDGRVIGIRVG